MSQPASGAQRQNDCGAKAYVERAIASFVGDPPDNLFQKGYLAALEVVRDEAFTADEDAEFSRHFCPGGYYIGSHVCQSCKCPKGPSVTSTERRAP